jgi:hypothetical protein
MDTPTAILYLGGSRITLDMLEIDGYLARFSNGHRAVRYLRAHIDQALAAKAINVARLNPPH